MGPTLLHEILLTVNPSRMAGALPWEWLSQQAARQTAVGEPRVRFYSHAVVTVPVLLLGFICLEGQMLVSALHNDTSQQLLQMWICKTPAC